ncbi:F0F1 ATP synthase subunit B [Moraxella oblonga]|uniref:F0F1 ATP synthase subunit B n=1 Tax=Moraxella oblonga TaxID=200413 RepID=UPI00082BE578|nr:F0F1 ATP synthase subunit B [Moraxella oblonga]
MNINSTIIGQMIAFAIFVWFCMKFVWPPLIGAINERQRKIEEGLNAAEKAKADLASAEQKVEAEFAAAKSEAAAIIDKANKTANQMIEDAKEQARLEGERIIQAAHTAIEQEIAQTREQLRSQVASLAVLGAEKILEDNVDEQKHASMLEQLAAKL